MRTKSGPIAPAGWALLWLAVGLWATGLAGSAEPAARPLFQFGVVADIQYADKPDAGARHYRAALGTLAGTVEALNREELAFTVDLGDLIDGNGAQTGAELDRVLAVLGGLRAPVRHVVGNHCLEVGAAELKRRLGLESTWYAFRRSGWRFLVLDGMDVSVKAAEGSPGRRAAEAWLAEHPGAATYNGSLGPEQLGWFKSELAAAAREGDRAVVFCHHPVHPAASDASDLLWNHEAVRAVMAESGAVAAWINGHDHRGGYAAVQGTHFLTVPGLVEAAAGGGAHAVVEVWTDRLVIRGTGSVPSRVLAVPARGSMTRRSGP